MGATNRELSRGEWVSRETLTAGEARAILAAARERGLSGMASGNIGMTRRQSWAILSAGIEDKADDAPIFSGIAKNIKREFGQ